MKKTDGKICSVLGTFIGIKKGEGEAPRVGAVFKNIINFYISTKKNIFI